MTTQERIRQHEEYMRNRTPEDVLLDALDDEADERWLAENPIEDIDLESCPPIEELWKELELKGRLQPRSSPRREGIAA